MFTSLVGSHRLYRLVLDRFRIEKRPTTANPTLYSQFAAGWELGEKGVCPGVESDFPGAAPSHRKIGGQYPLD